MSGPNDQQKQYGRDIENQFNGIAGNRPAYVPAYNPASMSISSGIDSKLAGIGSDTSALDKYKTEAMRTGPSSWAGIQNQSIDKQQGMARERAMQTGASSGAEARGQLAMQGGLSGGAAERLARSGSRDQLNAQQGIEQQGGVNKLQVASTDEQNRLNQLGALPGMENQAAQMQLSKLGLGLQGQQFDIGNQMNEAQRLSQYQQTGWEDLLKQLQGQREAYATNPGAY